MHSIMCSEKRRVREYINYITNIFVRVCIYIIMRYSFLRLNEKEKKKKTARKRSRKKHIHVFVYAACIWILNSNGVHTYRVIWRADSIPETCNSILYVCAEIKTKTPKTNRGRYKIYYRTRTVRLWYGNSNNNNNCEHYVNESERRLKSCSPVGFRRMKKFYSAKRFDSS